MADDATNTYWAAELDIKKLSSGAMQRFVAHLNLLSSSGRLDKMRSMLSAYYGMGTDGARSTHQLRETGEDGEVTELSTNQVGPIIANAMSLIAGQPLEVKAKARNTDGESLAATRLAQSLLEAYETSSSSKELENDTVRGGLIASSWVIGQSWSPRDGKEWMVDESGKTLYDGDVVDFVLPPWRCAFDLSASDQSKRKWALFRRPVSRWDTAAQFAQSNPELAQKLRKSAANSNSIVPDKYLAQSTGVGGALDALLGENLPPEDVLWVWELRHLPSPALPLGRMVRFVEPDLVLWDSLAQNVQYPYAYDVAGDDLHLYEYAPERVVSGGAGHTMAFNLGALQEFVDVCTASLATTINIGGQMHMWSQDTDGPQIRGMSEGNTVLISPTKPEPLQWPALKPEVLQACEWAISQARQSMALNDVVMGQPQKGMPAQAQALQRAQAQQYHAVAQAERVRLRRRTANGKLKLLKKFATSPRTKAIVGKDRAYELKEWQSKDLAAVDCFDVENVDPVFGSFEGKQALLDQLGNLGVFKDQPDALLTFLQTGSLDSVTTVQRLKRELVESNVSLLQKGIGLPQVDMAKSQQTGQPEFIEPPPGQEVVRILKSDPHHLAIPAYLGVLTSPASRADAKIMQAATEAIQLSLSLWTSLTPDEAMVYGIPPLPSQQTAAMGPPPGGASLPPSGGEVPPTSGPKDSNGVKLPSPPENPLTGSNEGGQASTGVQP